MASESRLGTKTLNCQHPKLTCDIGSIYLSAFDSGAAVLPHSLGIFGKANSILDLFYAKHSLLCDLA